MTLGEMTRKQKLFFALPLTRDTKKLTEIKPHFAGADRKQDLLRNIM
jgi:hypothetical protein